MKLQTGSPQRLLDARALCDHTAFVWLWGWALERSCFAPRLRDAFEIITLEGEVEAIAVFHRDEGSMWLMASSPLAAERLLDGVWGRRALSSLWLDAPVYQGLVEAGWGSRLKTSQSGRYVHMCAPASLEGLPRVGRSVVTPARFEELTALRALDAEQYGAEASQLDYGALLEQGALWVLREGGEVVSSLKLIRVWERANISSVWTRWSARRRGFARRLVAGVVRHCVELEGRRCVLNVVASNQAARGLYAGLGFEVTRRMVCLDGLRA